jgi:hypothetical protein
MTFDEAKQTILKYVGIWNVSFPDSPLWVNVTGIRAGMHFRFNGHFILVNAAMVPESIITTFFHEYGHAHYEREHRDSQNVVDSEVAAIRSSLELCVAEGLEDLAYREAAAIKNMAHEEPYRTAVQKLVTDPLWRKYARL